MMEAISPRDPLPTVKEHTTLTQPITLAIMGLRSSFEWRRVAESSRPSRRMVFACLQHPATHLCSFSRSQFGGFQTNFHHYLFLRSKKW